MKNGKIEFLDVAVIVLIIIAVIGVFRHVDDSYHADRESAVQEAYSEGYDTGYSDGYDIGYEEGLAASK